MWIESINIKNVRILNNFSTGFSKKLNLILGPNGSGKTSILESIYFLSLARTFRKGKEINIINSNSEFLRIEGKIINKNKNINK